MKLEWAKFDQYGDTSKDGKCLVFRIPGIKQHELKTEGEFIKENC